MTYQLEYMRPDEVSVLLRDSPWIFIPLGAMEWHGHHNVLGLDGLKAHGQLIRVAEAVGGVVYPPIYTGHYTGDENSPHTYMIGREILMGMLTDLLIGFEKDGFRKAVILAGHYPNHIFVGYELQSAWQNAGHSLELLSIRESHVPGIEGDHAGKDETSMMLDICANHVRLDIIADKVPLPVDIPQNWIDTPMSHPCHGVVGLDPRLSSAEHGRKLNQCLQHAIIGWIKTGEILRKYER